MLNYHLPKGFEDVPVRLDEKEQKMARMVIRDFFGAYHLGEIRQHLSAFIEIALTKDNSYYDTARERDNALWFYYQVERVIEAMWIEDGKSKRQRTVPKKSK